MKPDVRDRLVLPLLIPIGLLVVVALVAVGFGALLFFNPMTVSLTIATVVAAAILGAFGLASAQRAEELTTAKRAVISLAGILPLAVGAAVATGAIDTTDERVADRECEFCVPEDALRLVAENIQFLDRQIELPAEGEVSILFVNQDAAVPHNVAVYPQQEAEQPDFDNPVFVGEIFNGIDELVYTFEAPSEGTFFFRCDVHPSTMTGSVVFGDLGSDDPDAT